MEKITCAFLTVILVIAFVVPFSLALPEETKIYVDPPSIIDSGISPSQDITIDIMVANVTDLYSWQVRIYYNATILNVTDVSLPPNHVFDGQSYYAPAPVINNTEGYVVFGVTLLWVDPQPFDGTGVLCQISFHVKDRGYTLLYFSSPYGEDTFLENSYGGLIPASTEGGFFSNKIWGDVDGDGDVDGFDLTRMCGAYGSARGDPGWDEPCDMNGDGIIDGFDLTPACGNYGRSM